MGWRDGSPTSQKKKKKKKNIYIYIYIYYETQISLVYKLYACEAHISLNNRSHAFGKGDILFHLVDSRHCFSYKELDKV